MLDARGRYLRRLLGPLIIAVSLLAFVACGPTSGGTDPPGTGDVAVTITVVGNGAVVHEGSDLTCGVGDECIVYVQAGENVVLSTVPRTGNVAVAWDALDSANERLCDALDEQCRWSASNPASVTMTFAPHALRFALTGDGEGSFELNDGTTVTTCRESCGKPLASPRLVAITYFREGSTRTQLDPWPDVCGEPLTDVYCPVDVAGSVTVAMTWRHPPLAVDDAYVTDQETGLTVSASEGVLANDEDTPGDPLRASIVAEPEHGSLELDANGGFRYRPDVGFGGIDRFTYRVTDAFGNQDEGRVEIAVRPRVRLEKQGSGNGVVRSEPEGIDCGEACLADAMLVDVGATVVFTATPAHGSSFEWSGACTGSSRTCTVEVSAPTRVIARFLLVPRALTVAADGSGSGTITSDPPGIEIDVDAGLRMKIDTFELGTDVTLEATPAAGSSFTAWTGACEGQGPTCTITIDGNTTTTATFTLNQYDLVTSIDGNGSGSVTIDDDRTITSGDDPITTTHPFGTTITLEATPAAGSSFTGWTDACEGQGPTCTITIDGNTTTTVTFGGGG